MGFSFLDAFNNLLTLYNNKSSFSRLQGSHAHRKSPGSVCQGRMVNKSSREQINPPCDAKPWSILSVVSQLRRNNAHEEERFGAPDQERASGDSCGGEQRARHQLGGLVGGSVNMGDGDGGSF